MEIASPEFGGHMASKAVMQDAAVQVSIDDLLYVGS